MYLVLINVFCLLFNISGGFINHFRRIQIILLASKVSRLVNASVVMTIDTSVVSLQ